MVHPHSETGLSPGEGRRTAAGTTRVDHGDVMLSQEKLKPYVRTRMWDVKLKLTDTDNDAGDQRAGLGAVKGAGPHMGEGDDLTLGGKDTKQCTDYVSKN